MNPWDRRQEETTRAFEAFQVYLELGPRRSIRAVANRGQEPSARPFRLPTLFDWSSKHAWPERAKAYDDHVATLRAKAFFGQNEDAAIRMGERAERIGEIGVLLSEEVMRRLEEDPEVIRELPFSELLEAQARASRAYPRLVQTERLSRGMSTERVEEATDRFDQMTDAELDAHLAEVDAYLVGVDDGRHGNGESVERMEGGEEAPGGLEENG